MNARGIVVMFLVSVAIMLLAYTKACAMTCRLESQERLSSTTKACTYSCGAGQTYVLTVKGFCPRYVDYPFSS